MSKEKTMENNRRRKLWRWGLWLLLALVAVGAIGSVAWFVDMSQARQTYRNLSAEVASVTVETAPADAVDPALPEEPSQEAAPEILPRYAGLYAQNPDLFGWVKIDGTKVDYPVMYAPQELEKYLHTDFYGEYYFGGTPYLDVRCDADSENYLIYGHNMLDGSMFRALFGYEQVTFWNEHPIIRFDTLYAQGEYEVVAAFYDKVYYADEDVFKFYNVMELEDEAAYAEAIANFKAKALYETGVNPQYGTQLITLVTCAYQIQNGRFVVVAAKKAG